MKTNWEIFFDNLFMFLLKMLGVVFAIAIITAISFCIYKAVVTPNKITFCYVDNGTFGRKNLWGNIDWGEDRIIGQFNDTLEAVEYAKKIQCPIDINDGK